MDKQKSVAFVLLIFVKKQANSVVVFYTVSQSVRCREELKLMVMYSRAWG